MSTLNAKRHEAVRRRIVRLCFIVYFLLIFEGVLRKWAFPEYSRELFFVRDPFVLYLYIVAIRHHMWPRMRGLFLFLVIFSAIIAVLVLVQLMDPQRYTTPLLAAYGWRNYFFYIPFAFIVGQQFERDDLARLARYTMWLSFPMAVLVAAQYYSPPGSWINLQAFSGIDERIRPAGTFNSVAGQMLFTSSVVMFVLMSLLGRKKDHLGSRAFMLSSGAAALVSIAVSVSRGTVVRAALVALSAIYAGFFLHGVAPKMRAWILPIAIVVLGLALYPVLLPNAYHVTMARWANAAATESGFTHLGIVGRALRGFVTFASYIPLTPPIGFGMGIGGNASRQLGSALPIRAEDAWSRQIVDIGPVFGVIYILFRVVFTIVLGMRATRATRDANTAQPVLLFGFAGVMLLLDQITGNGVINGYCWMFVGLLMASIRIANRRTQ